MPRGRPYRRRGRFKGRARRVFKGRGRARGRRRGAGVMRIGYRM